jgi:hypothetical protein
MMTIEYLDAVKRKHSLTSDYQLAKLLDCPTPVVSRYRTGHRVMDDYTAARVAELLDMEPLVVIAQANAERERDEGKKAFWRKYAAGVIGAVLVSLQLTTSTETLAASTTYTGSDSVIPIMAVLARRLRRLIAAGFAAAARAVAPRVQSPA